MISQEAIQTILGIREKIHLTPKEMADKMNITFFPYQNKFVSDNILHFQKRLKDSFERLKVNVVPYEEALEIISYSKIIIRFCEILFNNFLFGVYKLFQLSHTYHFLDFSVLKNVLKRKRVKRGISVIAIGEQQTYNLPMDNTSSFTQSSVITILDWPAHITDESDFHEHFDTALRLFAYHMTNIVIAVDKEKWLLYNFNASHPIYRFDKDNFDDIILKALVPKIVAPIKPVAFEEFELEHHPFNVRDISYSPFINDFEQSARFFEQSKLYPQGRQINMLPFRTSFHRWIGKIHLDHRNGMSYGFLARQLPITLSTVTSLEKERNRFAEYYSADKDYFLVGKKAFLIFELPDFEKICMPVPDVWVLSQCSGCDKTHINPEKDLIKLGLVQGNLMLQSPNKLKLNKNYKPSFDTRVILAHALGNAIIASLLAYLNPNSEFARQAQTKGFAIAHWHGYFHPQKIPNDFTLYGELNPHVSCSSPQSAIYALVGKLDAFINALQKRREYRGDIHIEPHHGINITYSSLVELGKLLIDNPGITVLGNKYLELYNI